MRHTPWLPLLALVLGCRATPVAEARATPNLVLVLADDLGWGDPGCYRPDSRIPTPQLDRLADEGLRLTDAHSPSAVCTPTRYALLTGRYCWRTELKSGVLWGRSPLLIDPERSTIASVLKRAGYRTACIGKWHLGLGDAPETDYDGVLRPGPLELGFDSFFGIPASLDMQPYLYVRDDRAVERPTEEIGASGQRRHGGGGFWRAGPIAPGFRHADVLPTLAAEAERTIAELARADAPFFLYFALPAPHTPWLPSERFVGASGAGPYGDFVAQVDDVIGRVHRALEAAGVADDTLLVVTSDNGAHWTPEDIERWGHRANADWRGQKADVWEGGHRVPFLARWPGRVPAGEVRGDLVGLVDLLATFAALAGVELRDGEGEDSVDVSAVLFGEELVEPVRTSLVHHSMNGTFALREGSWKLVVGNLGSGGFTAPAVVEGAGQLYDLEADPGERVNRYKERGDVVERLAGRLEKVRGSR